MAWITFLEYLLLLSTVIATCIRVLSRASITFFKNENSFITRNSSISYCNYVTLLLKSF